MEKNIDYEWLPAKEFVRHPLHEKMLLSPEEKNQAGYADSIQKYGKLRPSLYIEEDGQRMVIDGWGYITDSIENGRLLVLALKVEATTKVEIMQVIAQANATFHTSYKSLYRIAEALYPEYSMGRGYRSDLQEAALIEEGEETEEDELTSENAADYEESHSPKRRPTVFQRIGDDMGGLPGTRIQHILLVGRVNPEYFDLMELNRTSLYQAYLRCKGELEANKPELPSVKAPIYISDNTGAPEFSELDSTEPTSPVEPIQIEEVVVTPEPARQDENTPKSEAMPAIEKDTDEPKYITVKGICTECGRETEVKVNINQLNKKQ